MLHAGSGENLEQVDPSDRFLSEIRDVDLITVTGGFSYIGERTLGRVLSAIRGPRPWVAAFSIRWMYYEPIASLAAHYGLETERLTGRTFPQRRFADAREQCGAMLELQRLGIDPTGKEADGYLHVEFLLARPPSDRRGSVEDLLRHQLNETRHI